MSFSIPLDNCNFIILILELFVTKETKCIKVCFSVRVSQSHSYWLFASDNFLLQDLILCTTPYLAISLASVWVVMKKKMSSHITKHPLWVKATLIENLYSRWFKKYLRGNCECVCILIFCAHLNILQWKLET